MGLTSTLWRCTTASVTVGTGYECYTGWNNRFDLASAQAYLTVIDCMTNDELLTTTLLWEYSYLYSYSMSFSFSFAEVAVYEGSDS